LLRSDKEINRYLDRPIAKTIDDARQFIDKINESILKNELIYWAITFNNQPNLIGTIRLWNISEDGTKAEIGFELLPEFHGKGIMQEVLPMIIDYGLETMGLNFIDGEVDPKNLRSIKLMEKYGFVYQKRSENTEIYSLRKPRGKKF
jgi:ribosomal-protein-alanine N-acetyltransferase